MTNSWPAIEETCDSVNVPLPMVKKARTLNKEKRILIEPAEKREKGLGENVIITV